LKVEVQSFRGCFSATIPWSPPDAQAVRVYGPIVNDGDAAIRLVGASSSAAGAVRLERGEPGSFDSVAEVKVPPGGVYAMAAWRAHLRLVDVAERPEAGQPFPLTLRFASGATMQVTVIVESASGH
jgi:copper(I)-binding protein